MGLSGLPKGSVSTTIQSSYEVGSSEFREEKDGSIFGTATSIQQQASMSKEGSFTDWKESDRDFIEDSSSSEERGNSFSSEQKIMKTTEITRTSGWADQYDIGAAISHDSRDGG